MNDPAQSAIDRVNKITAAGAQPFTASPNQNKYRVEMMQYPSDLLSAAAGNVNYVKFFINVQSDSKIGQDSSLIAGAQPDRSSMNSMVGKKFNKDGYAATEAIFGAGGGAIAAGVLSGDAVKGALAGAALKGGGALVQTTVLQDFAGVKFNQPSKRLQSAIVLYMPNQLSTRYSMQWSEDEMDMATVIASNPEIANAMSAAKESAMKGNVGDAAKTVGDSASKVGAGYILKNSPGLSTATRAASNPRKEQVFKGVDFRRFTFEYQFAPRNEKEAAAVLNIIYQFKYHMHPEFKDSSNFIYVYPSEFDIEYWIGSDENKNINKVSSCVLTEMNVNYSPNGVYSTFPDGTPTQINMTLNFIELEALTKERIQAGL